MVWQVAAAVEMKMVKEQVGNVQRAHRIARARQYIMRETGRYVISWLRPEDGVVVFVAEEPRQ